nr:unnamed protein product [Callosobruchus analis]
MSDETEVFETPNWLLELEAKRERRLKARLGHETGAGAACLKCADKCPGLDLHFWRKCCKACKCSKEEHAVPDDDIYGWAEFQLLVLPGKKDELELDWAPKGNTETVDKYLKTLPPDQLPVKGSQAAQDRKQLLHKQIPIHDIDPALCHDLTNDELSKMNEYIAHVKKSSVGVGRIVSLSNIIKGNLHMLNPSEAALISSRFPKGIPLSDVVKLCAQDKANNLSQGLQKIGLHSQALPNHITNSTEQKMHPLTPSIIRGKSSSPYSNEIEQNNPKVQYSANLPCRKNVEAANEMPSEVTEKYPHNPNFDPKKVPSQFVNDHNSSSETHKKKFYSEQIKTGLKQDEPLGSFDLNHGCGNVASAFVPYSGTVNYSPIKANYSFNPQGKQIHSSEGIEHALYENVSPSGPGFSTNLSGKQTSKGQTIGSDSCRTKQALTDQLPDVDFQRVSCKSHTEKPAMPSVVPGQYNIHSDVQIPITIPKNIRDLAFSTYDPSEVDSKELTIKNMKAVHNLEKTSKPHLVNQPLVKETISNAHPVLGDRNDIPEDRGVSSDDIGSTNQVKCPKKLSEIFPSSSGVHEDFVHPSDVRIGAIRDINIEYPENRSAVEGNNDFGDDYSPETIKEILNNIKLPDCHYCKKPFEENEFAVTIDRADVLFHARCFKCAGCNQMIVDNMYFYHKETDNIYCGRDYAKVRGVPRCKACDELIFTKEYTLAENATFHLKHFCCIECDTPLADKRYTLDEGMPYCLPCFEQSKANKCSGCLSVIKPDEIGCNLNGIHFHADDECFACIVCRKPLMGEKLLLRNEKLYCSHVCYSRVK